MTPRTVLRALAPRWRRIVRGFQSRAEHTAWAREVVRTRMLRPEGMGSVGSDAVPFLVDTSSGAFLIDHLKIEAMPASSRLDATPAAASIQATWPITSNSLVADQVSDFCQTDYKTSWARTFRLARFYEALDALTADVAYTYTDGLDKGLVLVTGGHYHSLKLRRTMPTADVTLRSYVTSAGGGASMEVRTDLVQTDPATGEEVLIQCCHTAMVALDKESRRPAKDAVPTLVIGDGDAAAAARLVLAARHKEYRKKQNQEAINLRAPISSPPTPSEMSGIHELWRSATALAEQRGPRVEKPETIAHHTHHKAVIVYPESRNLAGNTFGGFVMAQAHDLAHYAARFFVRGAPLAPFGLDEAVFHQPVAIGDMASFTAKVVHCGDDGVFRVFVTLGIVDPHDPERAPQRTNRLLFIFATSPDAAPTLLPTTYSEILMHTEGARRHEVEGLALDGASLEQLNAFFGTFEVADDEGQPLGRRRRG